MELNTNPGFLLHKIGALLERTSDGVLMQEFGLGYSQFKLLFALGHHPSLQQKEIAHYLGQTEASISRQIKLLKSTGLIEIVILPDNRKIHHIALTDKGSRLTTRALETLNQYYVPIFSGLTTADQQRLTSSLASINSVLEMLCTETGRR